MGVILACRRCRDYNKASYRLQADALIRIKQLAKNAGVPGAIPGCWWLRWQGLA
jgi:hypothetical protein